MSPVVGISVGPVSSVTCHMFLNYRSRAKGSQLTSNKINSIHPDLQTCYNLPPHLAHGDAYTRISGRFGALRADVPFDALSQMTFLHLPRCTALCNRYHGLGRAGPMGARRVRLARSCEGDGILR